MPCKFWTQAFDAENKKGNAAVLSHCPQLKSLARVFNNDFYCPDLYSMVPT